MRLVLRYESHDLPRFPSAQDVLAYGRLVKCAKASAGKRYGTTGAKRGNAALKWACAEAAVRFLRDNPAGQQSLTTLAKQPGQGNALTLLAQQLGRAAYSVVKRHKAVDRHKRLREE